MRRAIVNRAQSGTPILYSEERKLRLAYFVTHPIQYQAHATQNRRRAESI